MDRRSLPRWRTRKWLALAWTAAWIVALIVIENSIFSGEDDFNLNGFVGLTAFFAALVVWAAGFGLGALVVWLFDVYRDRGKGREFRQPRDLSKLRDP
jgi:hypothetical protein